MILEVDMSYKTLLVHAEPTPASDARIDYALHLAKDLEATLIGIGAEAFPAVAVTDPYGVSSGALFEALREQQVGNIALARKAFEAKAAGTPHEWLEASDSPSRVMARAARGVDLLIVGAVPAGPQDVFRQVDVGELILTAGRPVRVAPPQGGHLNAQQVLIAWKDTREARRAVADALPFLKRAKDVVVLEIHGEEDGEGDAASHHTNEVAKALGRHGIAARARTLTAKEAPEDLIESEAEAQGADLIVAGGYGHSRLGEWLMGGMTRRLLQQTRRSVLFSH